MVQSIFCIYLLLKVRNRFKSVTIIDIVDLGCTLYGEWMRPILAVLLVAIMVLQRVVLQRVALQRVVLKHRVQCRIFDDALFLKMR